MRRNDAALGLGQFVSVLALIVISVAVISAQTAADRAVAARFAPVFYQALGDKPRSDYVTNFDFDGDWRGDNNWENANNKKFPLKAYIYYSVSETKTHYFIHYAVFHPRDYKGGENGRLLSVLLRQGAEALGKNDPTGKLDEATLAHENDMEGALVVAEKKADETRVVYVETLQHNAFRRYAVGESLPSGVGSIKIENQQPLLYIEPKGHGIEAYTGESDRNFILYRYSGKAGNPETQKSGEPVGYELLPIQTTLWPKARAVSSGKGPTYGVSHDYALISINVAGAKGAATARKVKVGGLGSAFLGSEGGKNMARPPWGWFDSSRKTDPLGLWFFDPATVIKRDFSLGEAFSTTYVRLPFWAVK